MKVKDYDQMMSHLTEKDYQSNTIVPKKKPFQYKSRLETIKEVDPFVSPQTKVFLRNQLLDDALEAGYITQEQYDSAAKKFMEEVYPTLEKTYEDYDQFIEDDAMGRVTKNYGGRVGFSGAGLALAKEVGNLTLSKAKPIVKKLLGEIQPYGGAKNIGEATVKTDRTAELNFIEGMDAFTKKFFNDNFSAASRYLGQSREKLKAIYNRTLGELKENGERASITRDKEVPVLKIPVRDDAIPYPEVTTKFKTNPGDFTELVTKNTKNQYYNKKEIANMLGIELPADNPKFTKQVVDRLSYDIERGPIVVKTRPIPGQEKGKLYHFGDTVNSLLKNYKNKAIDGMNEASAERLKIEKNLDAPLYKYFNTFKSQNRTTAKDLGMFTKYAPDNIGHAVSLKEWNKFPKLFKNSNVNKINSLTFQDPIINQDVFKLTGYEKNYNKFFYQLENLVNKPVTKETQKKILQVKNQMEDNYNNIINTIGNKEQLRSVLLKDKRYQNFLDEDYLEYLTTHTDRVPKLDVRIPRIGEKFKSEDIFADMTNVNPKYILGYVDKINPAAKKLSDLNMQERALYDANLRMQNAEILKEFYQKAGFTKEEVAELADDLMYRYATGGRVGFSGGKLASSLLSKLTKNALRELEQAFKNVKHRMTGEDYKYEARELADELADVRFKSAFSDLSDQDQMKLYDEAYEYILEGKRDLANVKGAINIDTGENILTGEKVMKGKRELNSIGGRVGFAGGTIIPKALQAMFKTAAQVSDAMRNVKNSVFDNWNNVRMFGEQEGIAKNLTNYTNAPSQNRKTSALENIENLKKVLPEKYHKDLDVLKNATDQNNFKTAWDKFEEFDKTIDPDLKFENIPEEYFPMLDPLNDAFVEIGPRSSMKMPRYSFRTSMELDPITKKPTGKYTQEQLEIFDPETRTFRKQGEEKLVGVDTDKGKEGLN